MVFKNLEVESTSTQTKNIYVLCIKSLKEFHENSTKCDAIFAQSTDFGETNYSPAIQSYVLQQLRYELRTLKIRENQDGPRHCPSCRKPNKGAIHRQIAVIAVAPADKASFVYSYVQTRLKGQYN